MSARRSRFWRGGLSGRVAFAVLFVSLVLTSVLLSGGTQKATEPISGQLDGAPPPAPDVEAFLGIAAGSAATVMPESTISSLVGGESHMRPVCVPRAWAGGEKGRSGVGRR